MENEKITYDRNRLLGKGGYGAVFVGMFNGKEVAVKRIEHYNRCDDKEEKVLKILDHPNVVKLLGTDENDDFRLYAFDLCIGSLDKIFYHENDIKKYRGPPLPRHSKVFLQLAKGLAYIIHSKKLVHRDIKPENVLISIDGTNKEEVLLKWADFGLSKEVSENGTFEMSGARGTLFWMAPEILACFNQGKDSDFSVDSIYYKGSTQSDVFSAGCLFFKIVTGYHPFGDNIVTDVPPNVKTGNPVNFLDENLLPPSHFSRGIIAGMLKQAVVDRLSIKQVVQCIQEEMYNELSNICAIGEPSESDVNQLVMLVNDNDCPDLIVGGKIGCKTCKPRFTPLELLCLFNSSKNLKHCIEVLLKIGTSNMDQRNNCNQERNYQESPNGTRALDYLCKHYERDDLIDVIKLLIEHTQINFDRPTLRPNEVFQKVLWNASLDRNLNPLVNKIALQLFRPSELLNDGGLFDRQDLRAIDILKTHFVHIYPETTKNDKLLSLEDFFHPVLQRYSSRVRFKYERFTEDIDDNPESRKQFVSDLEELVKYLQLELDNIDLNGSYVITNVFRSLFGNTKWRTPANKNQSTSNLIINIIDRLIESAGVNINSRDSELLMNALGWLCTNRYKGDHSASLEVAKFLIEKGIDVSAENSQGWNALHCLCFHWYNIQGRVQVVKRAHITLKTCAMTGNTESNLQKCS